MPVLLGAAVAFESGATPKPWQLLITLGIAVLLQSAINTLNDYRDFSSGLDTAENCDDPTDAALIYEHTDPKAALYFGVALLASAAVLGAGLVYLSGPDLMLYAAAAILAIVLYTLPGISFSSLPLGELLSGLAMGGVLTCAAYRIQAGELRAEALLLCVPAVLTIANIMLVNNISDIEKDREGGRRTLPVCVGRKVAQAVLRALILIAAAGVALAAILKYPGGLAAVPALALGAALFCGPLFTRPIVSEVRVESMRCVLSAHKWTITSLIVVIILHHLTNV